MKTEQKHNKELNLKDMLQSSLQTHSKADLMGSDVFDIFLQQTRVCQVYSTNQTHLYPNIDQPS
jgi:hypothetical protein